MERDNDWNEMIKYQVKFKRDKDGRDHKPEAVNLERVEKSEMKIEKTWTRSGNKMRNNCNWWAQFALNWPDIFYLHYSSVWKTFITQWRIDALVIIDLFSLTKVDAKAGQQCGQFVQYGYGCIGYPFIPNVVWNRPFLLQIFVVVLYATVQLVHKCIENLLDTEHNSEVNKRFIEVFR